MKRVFLLLIISAITFLACNSSDSNSGSQATETPAAKEEPKVNPDYEKGLAIEAKQNCNTCHRIDEKLIGPSYNDIAAKYAGTSDTIVAHLAKKIIAGGSGVWGEVAMVAHPELSVEDAEAIVKYIFTFKK
ncbi:MAG: c-type cytochrome [Terrimonas sp.]|nr:c-type cytochrome [Terrimonas sp.]